MALLQKIACVAVIAAAGVYCAGHSDAIAKAAQPALDLLPGDTRAAERVIRVNMADPQSAIFSDVKHMNPRIVCGYVNGKNRMGAYAGNAMFAYDVVFKMARVKAGDGTQALNDAVVDLACFTPKTPEAGILNYFKPGS